MKLPWSSTNLCSRSLKSPLVVVLQRILIANRGEIALRILRTCRNLGREAVAIYTEVDRPLPHLKFCAEQVKVKSYLDIDDVVMAGKISGCDAVHPGYGLLSENAEFAEKVREAGMTFIGPSPEHIALLGDKIRARQVFETYGLAPIPGSSGAVTSVAELRGTAGTIGYPLVIKAAFGGGGRGIRAIYNDQKLEETLEMSRSEADLSFGQDDVFVEKLIENARHVELQLLGNGTGQCLHLGTRDCSIQRRYQKLIEEAPAPGIPQHKVDELITNASQALASMSYESAVTLEFLYAGEKFYFLEANTRLQVEHPVTEVVTGLDVVAAQITIAEAQKLPLSQTDVQFRGHAIELRILAEDESEKPSPGTITKLHWPGGPGIRVDSHLQVGYRVPHQYDSLVAKLIVSAQSRGAAIARAQFALNELEIAGIKTNVPRLSQILATPEFAELKFHTNWKPQ